MNQLTCDINQFILTAYYIRPMNNKNPVQNIQMKIKFIVYIFSTLAFLCLTGCSSPEQKLASYIEDGFEALDKNEPDRALADFRNALEIDSKSNRALWGLILTFEQQGNLRKVFDLTRQLVEQEPSNVEAHFKLANLYLMSDMTGYLDDQLNILEKLTKNNPDLIALKAEKALKSAEPEEARKLAEAVLRLDANHMSALMTLAKIYGRNGEIDQALVFIDKALVKHANQNSLYLAKISLLQDGLKFDKIPAVYEKLIQLNPTVFQYKKELALFLVQQKQYLQAEKLLKEILKAHPNNIESQVGLAKLTLATKDKAQAKKLFQQFAEANPDSMPLKFAHYAFYKEIGEFDQAKALIMKMIAEAKNVDDKLKAIAFYADDLLELGKRPEAVKLVDEVINKDPKNRDGLMVKAKLAMFDQKFNSAIGIYRNILADFPNDLAALIALGKAYEQSGTVELANEAYLQAYQHNRTVTEISEGYLDFLLKNQLNERAQQLVQEWVSASPNNPYYQKKLAALQITSGAYENAEKIATKLISVPVLSALGYQLQGEILSAKGQYALAIDAFLKAYHLDKENVIFLGNVIDAYLKAGSPERAVSFLQSVTSDQPNFYQAQLLLAKLTENTDPVSAENIYAQLTKKTPQRSEAYVNWSNLLAKGGNAAQAKSIIDQCLSINKENYECQYALADRYAESKQFEKAIAIYQKQVELHPSDILMRNNLASMLLDHGNDADTVAHAFYLAQTFANTEQPMFKDTYGWAAFKMGKLNEAISALQYAVHKAPEQGLFHYHLAQVYWANKQEKQAREEISKAAKLHNASSEYTLEDLKFTAQ